MIDKLVQIQPGEAVSTYLGRVDAKINELVAAVNKQQKLLDYWKRTGAFPTIIKDAEEDETLKMGHGDGTALLELHQDLIDN